MKARTYNTLVCSLGQTGLAVQCCVMDGSIVTNLASKKLGKAKGPQAPTLPCWRG